jgi:hypothetical protein
MRKTLWHINKHQVGARCCRVSVSPFNRLCSGELGEFFQTVGSPVVSKSEVGDAGCQLLIALYDGAVGVDTLDKMHYTMYMNLCSSSKMAIVPGQLPPRQRAAYFHCLHIHLQVLQWKSLSTELHEPMGLAFAE